MKIKEQLGDDCVDIFDFVFAENGLLAMKKVPPDARSPWSPCVQTALLIFRADRGPASLC